MRRAVLLLTTTGLVAAMPAAADASRPLPEIPPPHCDPAACPNPIEGVQECVSNGIAALVDAIEGTPMPRECDPLGRA